MKKHFKNNKKSNLNILFKAIIFSILLFTMTIVNAQKTKLKVGDRVPYFSLYDQNGNEFNTKDYIGEKAIVLFFLSER